MSQHRRENGTRIQWKGGKGAWIAAGLFLASQLAAGVWWRLPVAVTAAMALLSGLCALAVFGLRVEARAWWAKLLIQFFVAGASVLVLHGPFFYLTGMKLSAMAVSLCLALAVLLLAQLVTGSVRICGIVWLTLCLAFGMADMAVYQFNGNLITVNDIESITTALNVASSYYRFRVLPSMLVTLAVYVVAVAFLIRVKVERTRLAGRLTALLCLALSLVIPVQFLATHKPSLFGYRSVERKGIPAELILEWKSLRVDPPEGYSPEAVAALTLETPGAPAATDDPPHVIAIMIEAFSDLSVLGDIQTDVDPLPNLRAIQAEATHGYALVSTLGGGTARSEWEFLTGNSMAFLPAGSMPFRQYMEDRENAIVEVFENAGYHTVGMHPYYANGWGRSTVYPMLGFDEIYFLEDLDWGETVRRYVSDRAYVGQVIRLFEENAANGPLFLFGVTMQNHSGYNDPDYPAQVHITSLASDQPDAEQYLTLVRETDEALGTLIDYFRNREEHVQIVFFGDHQPSLGKDFYAEAGLQREIQKYLVPFVLWDNRNPAEEEIPFVSVNYLPALTLQRAGIRTPAYFRFLEKLRGTVPAMNHMGCVADGAFVEYEDIEDEAVRAALNDYEILQYGNMFDDTLDRTWFVGTPE